MPKQLTSPNDLGLPFGLPGHMPAMPHIFLTLLVLSAYPTPMTNVKPFILLAITLGEIGGAQSFVLGFAKWLKQEGYPVTIACGDGTWLEQIAMQADIPTVRLTHMGRLIRPWRDLRACLELHRLFQRLRPDIVHLNSSKMGILGTLVARMSGVPRIVYRIGGWVFLEPLSPFMRSAYRIMERWIARLKDVIVCVHPGDTTQAAEQGIIPREGVCTVPNGIDLTTFLPSLSSRQEARDFFNISPHTFGFVTIAGWYPAKDLPHYLEACAHVHTEEPRAQFSDWEGMERKR